MSNQNSLNMVILEINNYTPYIPSTVIGLVGLLFAYLYYYFKNKDDKKLKEIELTKKEDRLPAIEANLNELGVHFDTSNLKPQQKFELLNNTLKTKTRKYLIGAMTTIILSIIISLLIWKTSNSNTSRTDIIPPQDSIRYKAIINQVDSLLQIAQNNLDLENKSKTDPAYIINLEISIMRLKNIRGFGFDSLSKSTSINESIDDITENINRRE